MPRTIFLAGIMRERGISQGEMVRRTGLSRPTIMDAFHGRNVQELTLQKCAIALGVSLAELAPELAADLDGLIVR